MAGEYRMYRCAGCQTAFVSPTPSDEALARYYDTYHLGDVDGGIYDSVEARMQADFPAKLDLVRRETAGAPGRLLDVGCGKGFFVKCARDAGIDAHGCDLSATGTEYARSVLKVPAHTGLLKDLKPTVGQFDTATFWATIEHVPDPVATLHDIADVLKPGGRLFMDTGIGADWLDRLLPGLTQWYDPPQHLWVFSAAGLRRATERAGFTVQSHNQNFERSTSRRLVKNTRNAMLAAGLKVASVVGRMKLSGFTFTRYPVGNLQSIVAVKPR